MQRIIIYWRDIPSQVLVKKGRSKGKAMLSHRFQAAIDRAAMKAGKGSSDAYIAEWRRESNNVESALDAEVLAMEEAQKLESAYDNERLKLLVKNKGLAD